MVSSGGGDPPCICSGFVSPRAIGGCATPGFRGSLRLVAAGRRLAVERLFVLVRRFTVVRRFEVARRFPFFRCFEAVGRFTGRRFFRTNARLPHVSYASPYIGSCSGRHSNKEKMNAKRGLRAAGYSHVFRATATAAFS